MEDRFAGIREFVATVEGGNFTAAAVELGVTGSAVGKSISKLEAKLLHRMTRRFDLATEGEVYLISCRWHSPRMTVEALVCHAAAESAVFTST